jgi:ribosome-binding factor A
MLKVNSILREVIAEELEKLNDSRLEFVSVTGVDTAPNLRKAVVFVDAINRSIPPPARRRSRPSASLSVRRGSPGWRPTTPTA